MNRYILEDTTLILDSASELKSTAYNIKKYDLRVKDLPEEAKPRERLLKQGVDLLSTPELLAILLNTGTKKEDVLQMSSRILKEYGERTLLTHTNPHKIAEDLSIPLNKAIQIVACGELGRRFFQKKVG